MQLLIKTDFTRMERALMRLRAEQLPFAIARALTDTARDCQRQVTAELPAIFDRPTPFTMRAIGITPARKETQRAVVFVKDIQAHYLQLEQTGGTRAPKARALVEPGGALALDPYGNIPRRTIAQLKAQLARAQTPGRRRRLRKGVARRDQGIFYVPRAGWHGLPGGFYQRKPGHRLGQLIAFAPAAQYRPRFGYPERVERVARAVFAAHLRQRFAEALATARR